MLILIDDKVQGSNAPDALKSSALSDTYSDTTDFNIDLGDDYAVNCIGIGYTDATELTVTNVAGLNQTITIGDYPDASGLYELTASTDDIFSISHNGSYIGRIALGFSRSLGVAPTREPGLFTTQSSRVTASGQVIPGAGGYNGRRIAVDFRYKIDSDIYADFQNAFQYIAKGLPYFIAFTAKEQLRIPIVRIYASPDDPNLLFQSSVNRMLYSKQFDFKERF